MADAPPNDALVARQTALAATAAHALPLGRGGLGLRRAAREAGPGGATALVAAWAETLATLHAAGWGTEDPVAAALVTPEGRVRFLPDLVWPLGTLAAARPIACWLDVTDALRWLEEAGLAGVAPRAFTEHPVPWPGWPRLEPGPVVVIGPIAEVAALARHARLPLAPAASLARPEGVAWALEALARDAPWLVPVATPAWLAALPTLPRRILRLAGGGGVPILPSGTAEALGIRAEALLPPPPAAAATQPDAATLTRRLEMAALLTGEDRLRAEATALLDALDDAALRARPPQDAEERYTAVIDLARAARARDLTYRAALGRGLTRALAVEPERHRAGRADLVEARRLASTLDRPDDVVRADAALVLLTALDEEPRALPDPRPTTDPWTQGWRRAADLAAALVVDEGQGALEAGAALLATAMLTGSPHLTGAVVELLGGVGIATGHELRVERLLESALTAGHPPPCTALLVAWTALLAARRGATLHARDRLLMLSAALDGARPTGWAPRAAAWGALAARLLGSDGLAARLAGLGPSGVAGRLALGEDTLDHLTGAPGGLATQIAEASLTLSEARRRAARSALSARMARLEPERWPAGLALALGRLAASTYFVDEARRALELAAARGERHVERAALDALLELLPQLSHATDALEAVTRRRAQLAALEPPPTDADAPLPLSPDDAARAQCALVHRAATAAAAPGPARWRAAVEALCGPLEDPPPHPESARDGLTLDQDADGRWALTAVDGASSRLQAPPGDAHAAVGRALAALAPLFVAAAAPPGAAPAHDAGAAAWAAATDAALREGAIDFDRAIVAPFRAHDLTRGALRALLHLGLTQTSGLYRTLARRWGIADEEYQRFMDFLRRSNAALDYRSYRRPS